MSLENEVLVACGLFASTTARRDAYLLLPRFHGEYLPKREPRMRM